MKQYDYLLVGSGLFAGVFAYFAGKQGKKCLVLEKGIIWAETFTVKRPRASMSINTAPISSIPAAGRFGILSTAWLSSTAIPTARWPIIRARCTICLLI